MEPKSLPTLRQLRHEKLDSVVQQVEARLMERGGRGTRVTRVGDKIMVMPATELLSRIRLRSVNTSNLPWRE